MIFIIDEVDQTSNQEIFWGFLGMLRDKYMKRRSRPAFRSVILAGVYDIKNLKLKMRQGEEPLYNSPWNTHEGNEPSESLLLFGDCPWDQMAYTPFDIAAKFTVDMSFSAKDIRGMLEVYRDDERADMDVEAVSQMIYDYTDGYPFLVSRLCQLMDEESVSHPGKKCSWNREAILEAVKKLLTEHNTLFDDMSKKLLDSRELDRMLRLILFNGKKIPYSPDEHAVNLGTMFGYLKNENGLVAVANRIFETRLYNRYLSEDIVGSAIADEAELGKNQFVTDGFLNMDLVMEKFMFHYTEIYRNSEERFLEENGRRIFLTYLRPVINGIGNYYIEARTRDLRRTDVVIDFRGRQYVVEMKIWHGEEYNRRGELQLAGYLDDYGLDKGYLLSFNFNKNKKTIMKELHCNGKRSWKW